MTRPRHVTFVLGGLFLLLSACNGPKPKSSAVSAESHAPGTTLAVAPAACLAYPADAPGVIRAYCNGAAVVKLNIDGVDHLLKGGVCSTKDGVYSLNLGIIAGPELAGPRPDFIGLKTAATPGPFSDAMISIHFAGKAMVLRHNSGQIGPTGGDFAGTGRNGHPKVTASFTC